MFNKLLLAPWSSLLASEIAMFDVLLPIKQRPGRLRLLSRLRCESLPQTKRPFPQLLAIQLLAISFEWTTACRRAATSATELTVLSRSKNRLLVEVTSAASGMEAPFYGGGNFIGYGRGGVSIGIGF